MMPPADFGKWPSDALPDKACVYARNEVVIAAPAERAWELLIAAPQWSHWYRNAQFVRIRKGSPTALELGSVFSWVTFGMPITSTVEVFEPYQRLGWSFTGPQIKGFHGWLLRPHPVGCQVITEEAQRGRLPCYTKLLLNPLLWSVHQYWTRRLATTAERPVR